MPQGARVHVRSDHYSNNNNKSILMLSEEELRARQRPTWVEGECGGNGQSVAMDMLMLSFSLIR